MQLIDLSPQNMSKTKVGQRQNYVQNNQDNMSSAANMTSNHHTYLCTGLHGLQKEDKYTDFTIETDDNQHIRCHRVVMAAASPFFDTMFGNAMLETQTGNVNLPFDADSVALVIRYIYEGENIVTSDTVIDVYHLANYLQILPLINNCEQFLKVHMTSEISLHIFQVSKLFGNVEVSEIAKGAVMKDFSIFCSSDGMRNVDFRILKELYQEPFLNCSGTLKCKAAWIWLVVKENVDLNQVEELIKVLVQTINVENNDIIEACRNDVDELLKSGDHESILKLQEMWEDSCKKLWIKADDCLALATIPSYDKEECLVVVGGDYTHENKLRAFSFQKKVWYDLKNEQKDLGYKYAVCSIDSMLYLSGGTSSGNQRTFLCYDGGSNRWETFPDMPIGREQHTMCSHEQRIYVLGGKSREEDKLQDVHMFNLRGETWTTIGEIASPVAAARLVQVRGKILLLGGSEPPDYRTPSAVVQCFDTKTNYSWFLDYKLPFKCKAQSVAASALYDNVYLMYKGDMFTLKEKSKPEKLCSIPKAPMKGFSMTAFGTKLLIIGGEDDNFSIMTNVLQFDTATKKAVTLPIPTPGPLKDFVHAKLAIPRSWDTDEIESKQ